MNAKYFIDTNVFVYSFNNNQQVKQARSKELIQGALQSGEGIISSQVVQEFLNVALRKFDIPMQIEDARTYLRVILNPLCQVYPSLELYDSCMEIQAETKYSFYDSLILAAAVQGGCELLYSEDLQDGQEVHGLTIVNPYR
jgi:predicted nucleic acid-binding protein